MPRPAKDFSACLSAACGGSKEALEQMLEACRGYLLLVAHENLDHDLQAKAGPSDLVQETFLAAHEHFGQFRGTTEAELLAWLRQTLLNKLAKFKKRYRATAKRQLQSEVQLAGSNGSGPEGNAFVDTGSSPSAKTIRDEETRAVHAALARLPEDYRQVIWLRIYDQLSFEAIGKRMDRSTNAAEKLFARAVRAARQELETAP
jgi:RNA polymerase sigma-70 factor (ECF subfamily)